MTAGAAAPSVASPHKIGDRISVADLDLETRARCRPSPAAIVHSVMLSTSAAWPPA
jgi:hypothetical protein